MDSRVRTETSTDPINNGRELENEKNAVMLEKEKVIKKKAEISASKLMDATKGLSRSQSIKERKIALQQDIDKLRKKLRYEENIHRVLKRALTRPLGALPRLPPYLPLNTQELLAEVAILEEEVVQLEEQLIKFRQALYQEAIYISAGKSKQGVAELEFEKSLSHNSKRFEREKLCASTSNDAASSRSNLSMSMRWPPDAELISPSDRFLNSKRTLKKPNSCSVVLEDRLGKENQSNGSSRRHTTQSTIKILQRINMPRVTTKESDTETKYPEIKQRKLQDTIHRTSEEAGSACSPNKLSEDILNCLLIIFSQMILPNNTGDSEIPLALCSSESLEDQGIQDPYDICSVFGRRDVGPYKYLCALDSRSIDTTLVIRSPFLMRRLKLLLRKLALVELSVFTHQQKLAFWINMYNSCMMNAFLELGIPTSPQMIVGLMTKATINVGGHLLNAMTIEHFILRLPYSSKDTSFKRLKSEEMITWGKFGLDWPEPLVTFALSCGSWSSPAVRVYTASHIEKELETAKREYLQAAIGISVPKTVAIPKLLDWYLHDFAKDVESLIDWITFELPSELSNYVVECLQEGRRCSVPEPILVIPYDFRFRYLFIL